MSIPKHIIYIHIDTSDNPVLQMSRFNQFCIMSSRVSNPDYDVTILVNKPVSNLMMIDKDPKIKLEAIPQRYMDEIEERGIKSVVQKSDYIRYRYLDEFGGIYSDTDVIILKSLDDLLESGLVVAYQSRVQICSGFVMSEPNRVTLQNTTQAYKDDYKPDSWAYNAMVVLQNNAKKYAAVDNIKFLKYEEGFHFPHFNKMDILLEKSPSISSYCHHMWGSSSKGKDIRQRVSERLEKLYNSTDSISTECYIDMLVDNIVYSYVKMSKG